MYQYAFIFLRFVGGINSEESDEHRAYIGHLCADFESRLSDMIVRGIQAERSRDVMDPVYREVTQHALFCLAKVQKFHGRQSSLKVTLCRSRSI